ncbi:response regulator [Rhodobacteraceae bacterium]|nr:response regulator [Paracoccaceae bacterium]
MTDENLPRIGTIMLIDDEEVDQMLYRRLIDRSDHVDQILSFLSPTKALAHLKDKSTPKPDLMLLDINMPQMDGFEFLEKMEQFYKPKRAPIIIILSTSINPKDAVRAEKTPLVHTFKRKPLTEAMLREFRTLLAGDQTCVT